MFQRLKVRFAAWYINRQLINRYVYKNEIICISSFVALAYGFANCIVNPYSYAFYTIGGVYIYSRCNGRIYFFNS